MTRLFIPALAVIAALALAAGCGSGRSPRPSSAPLDPEHLRALPSQGLVVEHGHDIVLVGLDGRSYGRLVGFRPAFRAAGSRDFAYQAIADAADKTLLVAPGDHWYMLDLAAGRMTRLARPRLELTGGAELVGHATEVKDDPGSFDVGVSVERPGKTVISTTTDVLVSGDLVATRSMVLDLATGARWHPGADCAPAGVEGGKLLMVCNERTPNVRAHLLEVSPSGARRVLARFPAGLYTDRAAISPDGRWVAAVLAPGCGPPYTFVVPAAGGAPSPVTGERRWTFRSPTSSALGWSADNRIVADIQRKPDCESEATSGIYSIDPGSLQRSFVAAGALAMWSANSAG